MSGKVRQAGAGRDEDRVVAEFLEQLVDREGAPDHVVGLDLDAHLQGETSRSTIAFGRRNSGMP